MVIAEVPRITGSTVELVDLRHKRRDSVLAQFVAAAERTGAVRDGDVLLGTLARTARLGGDVVGRGFVIAHARSLSVQRPTLLIGRSQRGVEWRAAGEPVAQLVVLVLGPAPTPAALHAERIATIAHALRLQKVRQKLLEADLATAAALLAEAEA